MIAQRNIALIITVAHGKATVIQFPAEIFKTKIIVSLSFSYSIISALWRKAFSLFIAVHFTKELFSFSTFFYHSSSKHPVFSCTIGSG